MRLLPVVLLLITANAFAHQPAAPRFSAGAEVITIDVTVVDREGNPVPISERKSSR